MHRAQQVLFICSLSDEGFPDSSIGKKSSCNAGDPGLIPGWEDPMEKR